MKEIIATDQAPAAIGPYSQAVKSGGFLFISGQIPIHPETGEQLVGSLRSQTEQVLKNLQAICESAGASLRDVVKVTLYVSDLDRFQEINDTYATFFPENPPARATVQVTRLPKDSGIEIDAIVALAD
ncbi:MAG: RidA family protein [Armatimonadetes bacterium]|nr:RidA family protein [Armatimonadota bacterium]